MSLQDNGNMRSSSVTAKRIAERIEALETNASAVALQAGLGRSAVRDILSGKAQNPRIDTLQKISIPLKCSIEYLTGASTDPGEVGRSSPQGARGFDPIRVDSVEIIELGVFRSPKRDPEGNIVPWQRKLDQPQYFIAGDPRYQDYGWTLYQIDDESLAEMGILKGDYLTVAEPFADIAPLSPGSVVIVKRTIGNNPAAEISARVVDIVNGDIALTATIAGQRIEPIILKEPTDAIATAEDYLANLYFIDDGTISIEGIVVRVTREL